MTALPQTPELDGLDYLIPEFDPFQPFAQKELKLTWSNAGNGSQQNKYDSKTQDKTKRMQKNRDPHFRIGVCIFKLAERESGNISQVRWDQGQHTWWREG